MRAFFVTGILLLVLNGIAHAQAGGTKPGTAAKDSSRTDSLPAGWNRAVKLKSVVVTARRPLMEQKADRTIVNVDALISNTGSNALEVLANTPGLQVDDEGSVSLKGRTNVLVLIDGRPTQLSGADLVAYLKSLPSGVLDRIELMSNPPARYQAAGTGGIINIITKKSRAAGFNGSITGNIGVWIYGSSNNSFSASYRSGKWSISGNGRLSIQNSFFNSDRWRNYTNADGSPLATLRQHFFEFSNRVSTGGDLNIGYYFTKTTVLELVLNRSQAPYDEKGDYRSRFLDAGGALDSSMYVNSHLTNNWQSGYTALNFRRPFTTAGRELTAGLDCYTNHMVQHQVLSTSIYAPDNSLKNAGDLIPVHPLDMYNLSANADYGTPLGRMLKLEAGGRSSYGHISSIMDYAATGGTGAAVDSLPSNRFLYEESIYAGYTTVSRDGKRLGIKAGLRIENTVSAGHQTGNGLSPDTAFKKNYTNFFPTVYFSYKTDTGATGQIFLSFARRINRPDFNQLNPASFYFDKTTVYTGNPLLLPEFSYNTELSYVYKQYVTATLLYSDTRNLIMQTFQQLGDHFVAIPANIGRSVSRGMSVSAALPLAKWWTGLVYTEFFNNTYSAGPAAAVAVNPSGNTWRLSINNQFRLGDGWSAELSGFYRTKSVLVQSILYSVWYVNATVQKKIWNDKGALTLGLRDIFNSRITRREINTLPQQTVSFINSFDTRTLSLSLTRRFGKDAANKSKQKGIDTKAEINKLRNAN